MKWKTNWNSGSYNYADAARLMDNYAELRDLLNSEYGFALDFSPPIVDSNETIFTDIEFNTVESILHMLHVWSVPWLPSPPPWEASKKGPNAADINRWEQNGETVEDAVPRVAAAWVYSGEIYSGEY